VATTTMVRIKKECLGLISQSELRRRRAISGNQAKIIFTQTNALETF
jgi:hypothetical protein